MTFAKPLLKWFDAHQRPMPWRLTRDPYAIWLSETMLQQTQVATVIPYYGRFLERFPTIARLARADLQEVLSLWAGLGYYRRARHLHQAAREVVELHGGKLPKLAEELVTLSGVGRYTAGAIASIAFGQRVAVLDGNVMRVLSRLYAMEDDIALPKTQKRMWELAESLVPEKRPGDFNQAMMELGATVCTPTNPKCDRCPLRRECKAVGAGIQEELPIKSKKGATQTVRRVSLVLMRDSLVGGEKEENGGEVLLLQRPAGVIWEEMWEFPAIEVSEKMWGKMTGKGGHIETNGKTGFNWLAQIADEVSQRLGICVELDLWQSAVGHQLTHRTMEYRVLRGRIRGTSYEARLPVCDGARYQAFRWIRWADALTAGLPMGRISRKIAAAADVEGSSFANLR